MPTTNTDNPSLLDWNMPVIARGRMYIRAAVEVICYDIKDRSPASANR
jgi:hypothetical protein